MGYVRSRYPSTIGAALAACITTALAQDATDTFMRAAYCAGVLKESVKRAHQMIAEAQAQVHTCPSYSALSHQWSNMKAFPEDCGTKLAFAIEAGRLLAAELEPRRERYALYSVMRLGGMPPEQKVAAVALMRRGERDAAAQAKAGDHPGVARCITAKHASGAALVDCIAQHNQTYASIVRCQQMPDQLPF